MLRHRRGDRGAVVIGIEPAPLPMEGALPPDLQGTLFRMGHDRPGRSGPPGRLGTRSPPTGLRPEPPPGRRARRRTQSGAGVSPIPACPLAPSTQSNSATARPSPIDGVNQTRMPRCSGTPAPSWPWPKPARPRGTTATRATGLHRDVVGADRVPRPPGGLGRHPRRVRGRRPRADRRRSRLWIWPKASPRAFGSVSANGRREVHSRAPRPWSWNGPRGSTTSRSRRGTWCSSSRRPHGWTIRPGTPFRSAGCRGPRAGSAWCLVTVRAPMFAGSAWTPAW